MNKAVHIISLGCSKNKVDTEIMIDYLAKGGYSLTERIEEARYIIVNTCAFIEKAKREALDYIFEAAQYKKTGKCRVLAVTGCLAQRYSDALYEQLPEADVFIGVYDIPNICQALAQADHKRTVYVGGKADYLENAGRSALTTPKHYAYLKIAEGCNNRCSYCAIPSIRGPLVSRSIDGLVKEAVSLRDRGVRELILIAQDTTQYGVDLYGKRMLAPLIRRLADIDGIAWIRVLYMYPNGFTDALFELMAREKKLCRYVDMPIQHINDEIMRAMNRHTDSAEVRSVLNRLRSLNAYFAIRTSLIVGFPGETEARFEELCRFVTQARLDRVGVFQYSCEEGTAAAGLPDQIPEEIKEARLDRLMKLQSEISAGLNRDRIGLTYDVIIDEYDPDIRMYIGRSMYEAPEVDGIIYVSSPDEIELGSIVPVKITDSAEYDLMGEKV